MLRHCKRAAGPMVRQAHVRNTYYAAFILDPDGNRLEAVTFLDARR